MKKKTNQITDSNIEDIIVLIKSLGGAKKIYDYLKSKNININIDSIYKWKTNGIPYRYRSLIKELANINNINISNKIFPSIAESALNNTEVISNANNSVENNSILSIKKNKISIFLIFFVFTGLILQFYYFQHKNEMLEENIVKLKNNISSMPIKNYDTEMSDLKKLIEQQNNYNKANSNNIKENLKTTKLNNNKINELESNIVNLLNNDSNFSNYKEYNSSKLLISLILIKYNIKFFNANISNIELINNHFNKVDIPRDIAISLENLNKLSKIKLKNHVQLIDEFSLILKEIETNNTSKADNSFSLSKYLKKIIKINKIDYNSFTNKKDIYSNIIENLNIYNYSLIINELSSSENNYYFSLWVKDIKNLKTLNDSLEIVINWLILKG